MNENVRFGSLLGFPRVSSSSSLATLLYFSPARFPNEARDLVLFAAGGLALSTTAFVFPFSFPTRAFSLFASSSTDSVSVSDSVADADACCDLRKTRPLERALAPFQAWVTGRKRFQTADRANLELFEVDAAGRIKLNPLADWDAKRISEYMDAHDLPRHPMVAEGFPSLGCAPCTTKVRPGEDPRAGRWRGSDKTECGIHIVDGKIVRGNPQAA